MSAIGPAPFASSGRFMDYADDACNAAAHGAIEAPITSEAFGTIDKAPVHIDLRSALLIDGFDVGLRRPA